MQGRGSKRRVGKKAAGALLSPLMQGRGSKLSGTIGSASSVSVAPHAGARIETTCSFCFVAGMTAVAPHAGARIETKLDCQSRDAFARRPSCRGADRNLTGAVKSPRPVGRPSCRGADRNTRASILIASPRGRPSCRGADRNPLNASPRSMGFRRPSCRGADRNNAGQSVLLKILGSPLMQGRGSKHRATINFENRDRRRPSCRGADRNGNRDGGLEQGHGSPLMQGRGSKPKSTRHDRE